MAEDETAQGTDQGNEVTGDTQTPEVRTYSQQEFDRHTAAQRRRHESEASQLNARISELESQLTSAPKPPAAKQQQTKTVKTNGKAWEPSRQDERQFDRAAIKLGLNDVQYNTLERAWRDAEPSDHAKFVTDYAAGMWPQLVEEKPDDKEGEPVANAEKAAPITGTGSAANVTSGYEQKTPMEWDTDDIDRIIGEKGLHKGRRWIREQFENHLRKVRVIPEPKRR